jgi:hypothetical protein
MRRVEALFVLARGTAHAQPAAARVAPRRVALEEAGLVCHPGMIRGRRIMRWCQEWMS